MGNIQYSFPELKFEKPVYNQQVPQLNGISKLFETPQLKKPNDLLSSNPFIRRRQLQDMNNMTFDSNIFSNKILWNTLCISEVTLCTSFIK